MSSPSLAARASLAVALMVGFYLLAIAIAALLVYIPYAEVKFANRVTPKLALVCLAGAGIILWSILPRPDRFEAPGPLLNPAEQPKLFEKLRSVAQATNEKMPAEVYLVPEVNAWVTQRGGLMGFGSRRVMGLGLPLLQILRISELQAVLAHEFGHFYGGDTKLGPWIYKTRAAIGRTLEGLGRAGSLLQLPFLWYGKMFLRVTHAISRVQEYSADALAARTIGARPLAGALTTLCGAGNAFGPFFQTEFIPLLVAGYRAPLAEGFGRFMASPGIARAVSETVEQELKEGKGDPYDTHPPLRERLAALEQLPPGQPPADEPAAITLLAQPGALEDNLLNEVLQGIELAQCKPITWENLGAVYLPAWQETVKGMAKHLQGITPASFPELSMDLARLTALGRKAVKPGTLPPPEECSQLAFNVLGCALAVALDERGWEPRVPIGEPVTFRRGEIEMNPFGILPLLATGELTADAWRAQCAAAGIADLDLGLS